VEVVCSWRCLHSLTPDATQLAEPDWKPQVRVADESSHKAWQLQLSSPLLMPPGPLPCVDTAGRKCR
jgi:hypothetical protein